MVQELARRQQSGIDVRLLWDRRRGQVVLAYRDAREGDAFVADVPNADALTAFEHPNAYRPSVAA
jgi:hypothetical protein